MTPQHFQIEDHGQVFVVRPTYDRLPPEDDLRRETLAIAAVWDASAARDLIIDLAALPYFGSATLGWMVTLWKKVREREGKLVLCSLSEVGGQILVATRFHSVWLTAVDRAAAFALLGGFAPSA